MGITKPMARFIVREAKHAPIRGAVLLLGRQTVSLTPAAFHALLDDEGVKLADTSVDLDEHTTHGAGRGLISDSYFFRALGADDVSAIDVSDYEGADIVHDLNEPVPPSLENRFDFICNGSVLDNVFAPAAALCNVTRLLKPHGRVAHLEHASNVINGAYLQFSPNWFSDYYALNGFADCKSYLAFFRELDGPWELYACLHDGSSEPRTMRSGKRAMTLVIAEKSPTSTFNRLPTQKQYRGDGGGVYDEGYRRFSSSTRPILTCDGSRIHPLRLTRELAAAIAPTRFLGRKSRGYRFVGRLA